MFVNSGSAIIFASRVFHREIYLEACNQKYLLQILFFFSSNAVFSFTIMVGINKKKDY